MPTVRRKSILVEIITIFSGWFASLQILPGNPLAKISGIVAFMQSKGKSALDATPLATRQPSQDTVDSNMGDESADETRRSGDGGIHTGGREPADGQATDAKKMTFMNIPTDKSKGEGRPPGPSGADNIGYDSQEDSAGPSFSVPSSPDPTTSHAVAVGDEERLTPSAPPQEDPEDGKNMFKQVNCGVLSF